MKAKPWSRSAPRKRVLSLDDQWAEDIEQKLIGGSHPDQKDAILDDHRRVSLLVGRGGGKTSAMRARAVRKMLRRRRAKIIYVALSRPNARDINWEPLKELIHKLGETDNFEFAEATLTATCKRTGSTYQLVGADDRKELEKKRGQPFDEVQIDEAGSWDPELLEWFIDRIVGPRLGERQGCIVMGGTPGHILRGTFYDATGDGPESKHRPYAARKKPEHRGWTSWSSHAWTLETVVAQPNAKKLYPALVALWVEALIEKADKKWSDEHPIWRREYLGQWAEDATENVFKYTANAGGKAWNRWNPFDGQPLDGLLALRAAIAKLPNDVGTFHFVLAGDKGSSDPFALNVFAFAPGDDLRRIWHVYWFERTKMYAKPIAEILLGDERNTDKPAGVFGEIGWPDGVVFDADEAFIDELRDVYGIGATKADKKPEYKIGAIELVNGDLIDGRILVLAGSPLEKQIERLQWKVDEFGRVKENKAQANHSTDCLVYGRLLIANLFETGTVSTEARTASPRVVTEPAYEPRDRGDDLNSLLADPEFDDSWSTL